MNRKKLLLKIVRFISMMTNFNFDNILLDEKSYENILIYDFSYKTLIGAKPLIVVFRKVHSFVRNHGGTKYLVLISLQKI